MGHEETERRSAIRVRVPGGIASLSLGPETHNLNVRDLSVGGALLSGEWGEQELHIADSVKLQICWPIVGPTAVLGRVVRVDNERGELAVQFNESDDWHALVRSLITERQKKERPEAVVYYQSKGGPSQEGAEALTSALHAIGIRASIVTSSADLLVAVRRSGSRLSAVFLEPCDQGRKLAELLSVGYPHVTRVLVGEASPEWEDVVHRGLSLPVSRDDVERLLREELSQGEGPAAG